MSGKSSLQKFKERVFELFKFGTVGFLGTLTNLTIFFLMVDLGGFDHNLGSVAGFLVSVTQNFILNKRWTFSARLDGPARLLAAYAKFVGVALGGLFVNILALNAVLAVIVLPYKTIGQGIGILAGMSVNYLGFRYLVFRKSA